MKPRSGRESALVAAMTSRRWRTFCSLAALGWLFFSGTPGFAQQLDTDALPRHGKTNPTHTNQRSVERYVPPGFLKQSPDATNSLNPAGNPTKTQGNPTKTHGNSGSANPPPAVSIGAPLKASVTRTLYLPPAMYGQWNVTGRLTETNAPDVFSPSVSDIWLLKRDGDQVTVTNPVNGAFAAINVDKAEGDQATFHRSGTAGKNAIFQEIPTITVHGDTFSGQSLNKIQQIRDGRVTSEIYGIYHLEASRLSEAHARFHPEAEQQDPDLQIEEIR